MYNDDYGYYNYGSGNYKKNRFSLKNLNLKGKLILGAVLLIGLIIVLIGINSVKDYFNSYGYLEKKMISAAKDYVNKNNLIVWDEVYLDVTKLETEIKKNCTIMSGVFVDSSYNYKAYLDCDNYESKVVNNKSDNVSLNGDEVVILGKGVTYNEQGVTGNNQVSIQGKVGNDEGVYTLKYIVVNNNSIIDTLERKVVVIDELYINNLYPSLILKGDKIEYVQKGHKYQDEGVFASDALDLDLTNKVKTSGRVNVNTVGEYDIIYIVTNSRGYSNTITRKVVVVDNFSATTITGYLSPETMTSGSVTITLKVVGDNYDYMKLPNGSKTSSKTIEYPVNENGTYKFISYDKDGKSITKIIPVENIDNTKPNASCVASVYNDYTQIYVTPYSGKEIKSYNYMINGVSSGELVSTNYKSNVTDVNNVSVIIKDSIGNSATISCTIEDNRTDDMEVVPIPNESFKCNTDVSSYNVQLANKVNKAGIRTREGVAAAATYLTKDLGYKIGYWWAGKHDEVGLNSEWGCSKKIWDESNTTGPYAYGTVHPYGLDCTGFIKWSFVNAGFDANLIPRYDMKYKWGTVTPKTIEFASAGNQVNDIKPGDVLWRKGHAALIVAVDDTRIKIAQAVYAGIKEDLIDKFTGEAITNTNDFTHFILLDEFYQQYGN